MALTDSGTTYPATSASRPASGRGASAVGAVVATLGKGKLAFPVKLFMVCVAVPFDFAAGSVILTGARIVLMAMIPVMLARLLSGKYGKLLPTDYLFALHMMWVFLTIGYHNPNMVIQNVGASGSEFMGGYLMGRAYIRSKEDMVAAFRFSIMLVVLTLPLALFETLTGRPVIIEILNAIPVIGGSDKASTIARMGLERVQMGYSTPIHYGVYCTMVFAACFVGMKQIYSQFKRMLTCGIIGVCIFLSLSSGALLPLFMQLGLIGWGYMFRKNDRRWLLLIGFVAFCYVTVDMLSNRTPYRVFMTYATFSPGTAYWRAAINEFGMNNVWAHPIMGIGIGYWVRPAWMHSSSVDNFWLLMAMRHGIPGFALVFAGYCAVVWQVMRASLGKDPVLLQLRLAWVFTYVGLAFTLTTVHVWSEIYAYVFFYLGAALWMVTVPPETADDGVETQTARAGSARVPAPVRQAVVLTRDEGSSPARGPLPASRPKPDPAPDRGDTPRYSRFPAKERKPE